jgi:hypothetical protein
VKTARVLLLLLLAALLPIRGAMAAAMLCPMTGQQALQAVATVAHEQMDHAMAHGDAAGEHHGAPDVASTDKCTMCAAFCSLTSLPSDSPRLAEPPLLAAMKFPDLSTPAPSFLSGGQERPPRTL